MHLTIALPGLIWYNRKEIDNIYTDLKIDNFNKILKHAALSTINYSYSDLLYLDNNLTRESRFAKNSFAEDLDIMHKKALSEHKNLSMQNNNIRQNSLANQLAQQLKVIHLYKNFLFAEPTHLRVDNERLLLAEPELLDLSYAEEQQMIDNINFHFNDEIKLYYIESNLWLIGHNLNNSTEIKANLHPLIDIIGENAHNYLSTDISLNKLINEIQMLLHSMAASKSLRRGNAALEANSIWLWDKPLKPGFNYTQIYTNCKLKLQNKAKMTNNIRQLPRDITTAFADNNLLIIDSLYHPCCYRDSFGFRDILEQLDASLALELRKWLDNANQLDILIPQREYSIKLRIKPNYRFKFWQNKRLTDIAKETHAL